MTTTNKYGLQKSTESGVDLLWRGPQNDANLDAIDRALWLLSVATINTQTGDYVLALEDRGGLVRMDKASGNSVTVPKNATVPFPIGTNIASRAENLERSESRGVDRFGLPR